MSSEVLLPIEIELYSPEKIQKMFDSFDIEKFAPIPVASHPKKQGFYILGDGHNRAAYCYLTKQPATIKILETDKDIYPRSGAFRDYNNIKDFQMDYVSTFGPFCERNGIFSIEDLVRNHAKRNPSWFIAKKLGEMNHAQS